jgi:DNA-binding NarL/FixJ family response regulator
MIKLNTSTMPKIAVVINPDTPVQLIKELRKTDISGIVPSAVFWGIEIGTGAVHTILNTGSHWPKDIIASLPGNIAKPVVVKSQFKLTGRQQQIVDLICTRGLSNKRIATTLRIAESTVKIHVSAALKAYGVRTRVQLALTANAMAPAQLKLTN